jgi:hypothetical protein
MYYLGIIAMVGIAYYALYDRQQINVLYASLGLLVLQVVAVTLYTPAAPVVVPAKKRSDGRSFSACQCTDPSTGAKTTGELIDGRCYCIANVTQPWTTAAYCRFWDEQKQTAVNSPNIGVNKHGQLLCNAPY